MYLSLFVFLILFVCGLLISVSVFPYYRESIIIVLKIIIKCF